MLDPIFRARTPRTVGVVSYCLVLLRCWERFQAVMSRTAPQPIALARNMKAIIQSSVFATLIPHRPGNLRYVGQETKAVAKREHCKHNIRDSHPADVLTSPTAAAVTSGSWNQAARTSSRSDT